MTFHAFNSTLSVLAFKKRYIMILSGNNQGGVSKLLGNNSSAKGVSLSTPWYLYKMVTQKKILF